MSELRLAICGATGAVGREIIDCLAESPLKIASIRLLASPRSAGMKIPFRDRHFDVGFLSDDDLIAKASEFDIVFLATGGDHSRRVARAIAARGPKVIDNSSALRRESDVPLVVPEINGSQLADLGSQGAVIANPNCSTIIALMALAPLHRVFGLQEVVASTYQAVSGAGQGGIGELRRGIQNHLAEEPEAVDVFARPIAFNVIPFIGALDVDGDTDEEQKMLHESRKILGLSDLDLLCTAVRVPVIRAHAVALTARFAEIADRNRAAEVLRASPGLAFSEAATGAEVPTPRDAARRDEVLVTRLRQRASDPRRLSLFVLGDQLRKGAALNAVQIAGMLAGA